MHLDPRLRRVLLLWLAVMLTAAIVLMGIEFFRILALEARGPLDPDVANYFHVGRGILNGLTPYRDLYETKPPGIFFLTALSLLVSHSERFLAVLQLLMYIALPLLCGRFAYARSRHEHQDLAMRYVSVAAAIAVGILLTMFVEEHSGAMQTEAWAGFGSAIYVLGVLWPATLKRRWRLTVMTAGTFLTLVMKEPMLLTLLAAAIVLCRTRREFWERGLLPIFLGGIGVLLVLLFSGYLIPYVTIHLPIMLFGRVATDPVSVVWLRWLSVRWLFANLTTYHVSAPLLGYLLLYAAALAPLARRPALSPRIAIALGCSVIVLMIAVLYSEAPVLLLRAYAMGIHFSPESMVVIRASVVRFLGVLPLVASLVWYLRRRRELIEIVFPVIGLCLASQAVGISIYAINHFAFAFPFYFALALLTIHYIASREHYLIPIVLFCCFLTIIGCTYKNDPQVTSLLEERMNSAAAATAPLTTKLDALMNACAYERYYPLVDFHLFAFTHHSSIGPLVVLSYMDYLPPTHPIIQQTIINVLEKASVLIAPTPPEQILSPEADSVAKTVFTTTVPDCAKPFLPIGNYTLLFRKPSA